MKYLNIWINDFFSSLFFSDIIFKLIKKRNWLFFLFLSDKMKIKSVLKLFKYKSNDYNFGVKWLTQFKNDI